MTDIVTPEVLWWALLPVLFLSAGGMLLLTVASRVRRTFARPRQSRADW